MLQSSPWKCEWLKSRKAGSQQNADSFALNARVINVGLEVYLHLLPTERETQVDYAIIWSGDQPTKAVIEAQQISQQLGLVRTKKG